MDATAALLRGSGYNVAVASSGPEALRKAAGLKPDVVLLDPAMPWAGGDGLARRLKVCRAGRPPLVVAVGGHDHAPPATRAGIDLHLAKPVEPGELGRVIRQFEVAAGIG